MEGKDGDGKESINLGVSSPAQYYKIPKSCCKKDIPATDCKQYLAVGASNGTVYSEVGGLLMLFIWLECLYSEIYFFVNFLLLVAMNLCDFPVVYVSKIPQIFIL